MNTIVRNTIHFFMFSKILLVIMKIGKGHVGPRRFSQPALIVVSER